MPRTVLVADDSATIRRVVEIALAGDDYRVVGAASGEEALTKAKEARPDVVLADVTMPGMSGYDLCRAVRGDPSLRSVPVVILASLQVPYDDLKGRDAGANDHLAKPFETQALIDKIGQLLSRGGVPVAASAPAARPAAPSPPGAAGRPPTPPPVAAPPAPRPAAPTPFVPVAPPVAAAPTSSSSPSPFGGPSPAAARGAALPSSRTLPQEFAAPARPQAQPHAAAAPFAATAGGDGALSPAQVESITRLTREVIERVVWEVVPELAEAIIREELKRLTRE